MAERIEKMYIKIILSMFWKSSELRLKLSTTPFLNLPSKISYADKRLNAKKKQCSSLIENISLVESRLPSGSTLRFIGKKELF